MSNPIHDFGVLIDAIDAAARQIASNPSANADDVVRLAKAVEAIIGPTYRNDLVNIASEKAQELISEGENQRALIASVTDNERVRGITTSIFIQTVL